MNIKSIALLFAAISGVVSGYMRVAANQADIAYHNGNVPADQAAAITEFKNNGHIAVMYCFKSPTAWASRPNDLIDYAGVTEQNLVNLNNFFRVMEAKAEYYGGLKDNEISKFIELAGGGAWAYQSQHDIMKYLDPALVSKVSDATFTVPKGTAIFDPALGGVGNAIPVSFFNRCSPKFLKFHADAIMNYLETAAGAPNAAQNLTASALQALLSVPAAANRLTFVSFKAIMNDPKKLKVITSGIFKNLGLVIGQNITANGHRVPSMGKSVFSELRNVAPHLHDSWFSYMSEKQMLEFQKKENIDADTQLKLDRVGAQTLPGVTHKQLISYFKNKIGGGGHPATASLIKERFWKRLGCNGNFKAAVKEIDPSKVPNSAFRYMTLKQRQAILSAFSKEGCDKVPEQLFSGKPSRYRTLKVSKKCFEDMDGKKHARFAALAYGMVDASVAANLDADDVKGFELDIPSAVKGEDNIEVSGILALNILRSSGSHGKSVMSKLMKNNDIEEMCKEIEPEKLLAAKWVQGQLSRKCVSAIETEFDWKVAKALDPVIWQGFSFKQIKKVVANSGKKWKGLRDSNYIGLARNKEFAQKVFKEKEKEDGDDNTVVKVLFQKLPADKVTQFFGWDFVKHVDSDQKDVLAKNIKALNPKALSGASHSYFISTFKPDQVTDAQYGTISDDVADAYAYSAHLTPVEVGRLSVDRCGALSPKFVARMKPSAKGSFSPEQLAAIPAESMSLVSVEAAKAFKHPLSPAQQEMLGSALEQNTEATKDGATAVGSFMALAAAAAGSAAILL